MVRPPASAPAALEDLPVSFHYDDFGNTAALQLNGTAIQSGTRLRLTDSIAGGQSASVFRAQPVTLGSDRSFSTYLRVQMTDGGGIATQADGLVLVLQGSGPTALGPDGLQLAYAGISPSLGVELDTFLNGQLGDPDDHHVGTHLNGDMTRHLAVASLPQSWALGSEYSLWVDYEGSTQTLEVRIAQDSSARPEVPLLTQTIDLSALPSVLYPGVTSATYQAWARHWVDAWYFEDHYAPIDVAANSYQNAPANLALSATPSTGAHQSALTAQGVDADGQPHAGWTVTFSTSLGSVEPATAITDASGVARTTLTAQGVSGSAHVVAGVGTVTGATDVELLQNPSIVASSVGSGTVTPAGVQYVLPGASAPFTFAAVPGNAIRDVQVDGASLGPLDHYNFEDVTGDHTLNVTFVEAPYRVTVSASGQGVVSPPGGVWVPLGGSAAFQFTPDADHRLYEVKLDGASVGDASDYTLTDVSADHQLEAVFVPLHYGISCQQAPPAPSSPLWLLCGALVALQSRRRRKVPPHATPRTSSP